ncbi:MAG: thioredoxin family protein [Planctomycetota bacterium]
MVFETNKDVLMRILATTCSIIYFAFFAIPLAADIPWQSNLREAHAAAQKQNKPLLLHFYSDSCPPCRVLEEGAFKDAKVQSSIAGGFVAVKINVAEQQDLAEMFKVRKIPTDVIVTTDGQPLSHRVSPLDVSDYVAMLDTAIQPLLQARQPMQGARQPMQQARSTGNVAANVPPMQEPAFQRQPAAETVSAKMPQPPTLDFDTENETSTQAPSSNPYVTGIAMPKPQTAGNAGTANAATTNVPNATLNSPTSSLKTPQAFETPTSLGSPSLGSPTLGSPTAKADPSRSVAAEATTPSHPNLELSFEGYCSVTVVEEEEWLQGNPKYGVVHLGQLYLFASEAKMQKFLANPVPYTPMLNGIDVVRYFEERIIVPGKREFAAVDADHKRVFFFADEAALEHFEQTSQRYVPAAIEVMNKAIAESNPTAGK